ncbi:unnamed protein product [Acidithrix sp. C25]|nr:unnamed protein product [Acidithrix sp. C25]
MASEIPSEKVFFNSIWSLLKSIDPFFGPVHDAILVTFGITTGAFCEFSVEMLPMVGFL